MKKILYIHHASGWGGASKSLIATINSLDKRKYEAHVLLLKNTSFSSKFSEQGISYSVSESYFYNHVYKYFTHSEANYIPCYNLFKFIKLSICWLLSRHFFAKKELLKHNFDIVHLNSSVLTDWIMPAKTLGKVIMHIREPFRKGKLDILHIFFRNKMKDADKIIAISYNNANRVNLLDKTIVIYNYAELPLVSLNTESYSSGKVLYLGGSAKIKGFYTMVKALDYLNDGIQIIFAGNYANLKKRRSLLRQFARTVLFYGKRKKKAILHIQKHPKAKVIGLIHNVNKYMEEMCCLVSPFSTPHFARPVIEAHLHKKPVIGSDVEGMEEMIQHGKNGLIFPVNDARKLAEAINFLANNPKEAQRFGEFGFNLAKDKFTPQNIRLFEKVYELL